MKVSGVLSLSVARHMGTTGRISQSLEHFFCQIFECLLDWPTRIYSRASEDHILAEREKSVVGIVSTI